jgi:hypothetical protein
LRIAFSVDVPALCRDWFELSADSARLPPDTFSEFASGMQSLVGKGVHKFEVFESVVLFVSVSVVDLIPGGDRSVCSFPLPDVRENKSG